MEVLSSPLFAFALVFMIHNTFQNRERKSTDSDRALCMRCENVHNPVSEWDFAFPLAHPQAALNTVCSGTCRSRQFIESK